MRRGLLGAVLLLVVAAPAGAGAPDARLLAYEAPDGIHLVQADGGSDRLLRASRRGDESPQWSSDGRRIAVYREHRGIFVLGLDGSRKRLTDDPGRSSDEYPVWSPDGAYVYFDRNTAGTSVIYRVPADGGSATPVLSGNYPAFAPTGAFAYTDSVRIVRNYVGASVYGRLRRIDTAGTAWAPAWFPDGSAIVFETDGDHPHPGFYRDYAVELHSIRPDGTGETTLTNNRVNDADPAVSPDGTTIAFDSDRFGWAEVLLMNADGSHQRRLTHELRGDACCAAWRPTP